jgi:apolipoprotein N-acyltransferase
MPAETSMTALAERVRNLGGWRRHGVALAAGLLSVLAMAPFFLWPVLWLTLPVLVWLIDGALRPPVNGESPTATPRGSVVRRRLAAVARLRARPVFAAAEVGWWFGFGYFLAGLYWIGVAFLVDTKSIIVFFLPVAVVAVPAGLALFYAAATALSAHLWLPGATRVVVLALALSAMEWMRGHILSGFPWNGLGYALTYPLPLMQSAAVLGIYGLALCAVLIFALPAVLWAESPAGSAGLRARLGALAIALLPLLAATLYGFLRLAEPQQAAVPGAKIRIVQASVPQKDKWLLEKQDQIFRDHVELSAANAAGTRDDLAGASHVVWPEAAMPFVPLEHPETLAAIGRMLPVGKHLISGALRVEPDPSNQDRPWRFFNSLLVFGEKGSLVARYDKIHLVPFGEYLPLQPVLEAIGLRPLTRRRGRFEDGVSPRPLLRVPGLPAAAPIICYEAIFPGAIIEGPERPGLMVNVTNDGWFGNTTGPRQHFHQARVRAVEEGLPLVRAANNGISAMIDGHGRVLGRLDVDVRGVIDADLPAVLAPPIYARFGDLTFLFGWLVAAVVVGLSALHNRRPTHAAKSEDM